MTGQGRSQKKSKSVHQLSPEWRTQGGIGIWDAGNLCGIWSNTVDVRCTHSFCLTEILESVVLLFLFDSSAQEVFAKASWQSKGCMADGTVPACQAHAF